jgi:hypothetical protein
MEYDPSSNPPCYKKKDDVRNNFIFHWNFDRVLSFQDLMIQPDDSIRVKIAGLQVDAKDFVCIS